MATAKKTDLNPDPADTGLARIVDFADREADIHAVDETRTGSRFLQFICELRRRRVCRAATIYSVAFWLVCQVVDVVAPALDLPEWTLKLVIVLGLILFPVTLVLSWLIDITPQGLVADVGDSPVTERYRRDTPLSKILDCALLAAAVFVGAQLSTNMLLGDSAVANDTAQRVIVEPFQVLSGHSPDALAAGLVIELQHELRRTRRIIVIDADQPDKNSQALRLNGVIVLDESGLHVTATLVDSGSGVVTWSKSINEPLAKPGASATDIASYVAAALPIGRLESAILEHSGEGG